MGIRRRIKVGPGRNMAPKDCLPKRERSSRLQNTMALKDGQTSNVASEALIIRLVEIRSRIKVGSSRSMAAKDCWDRFLAIRRVDFGTVSWWQTQCPAYAVAFRRLFIWPRQTMTADFKP